MTDDDRCLDYTLQDCPRCGAAGPHLADGTGKYRCGACDEAFRSGTAYGGPARLGPDWVPGSER